MALGEGPLYALIIACEAGFWAMLFAGLTCRYLLRWTSASRICLLCVPLIDLLLLALTVVDLRGGAVATFAHGLAVVYIGFTVAFATTIIGWADQKFAHRFAGAVPAPPAQGWASVRYELVLWARCLLAVAIIYLLLSLVIALAGRPNQTKALAVWYWLPLHTAFLWFLFGPVWSLIFFKR